MSKRKSTNRKSRLEERSRALAAVKATNDTLKKEPASEVAKKTNSTQATVRETIESVVVAFVLAFLFRTFEAEAFVIPTGSMAPTLMGRHKDVICPICGTEFRFSASEEVDPDTNRTNNNHVVAGTCPMCRHTMNVSDNNKYPSYNGDRILVGKYAYQFSDPQRWDVAVFKYPGGAKTNFIKRIVGLPDETLRIWRGDVYIDKQKNGDFQIARKPPAKLRAMLQPVYDNDVTPALSEYSWPLRWNPVERDTSGAWSSDDGVAFSTDGSGPQTNWIRYQHLVPSDMQWREIENNRRLTAPFEPRPQLISDFNAYNTCRKLGQQYRLEIDAFGIHWVSDLALECTLNVESSSGEVILELVEGGHPMQARIDVATGRATLSIGGMPELEQTVTTDIRGPGQYKVMFSNIDKQLRLWLDGAVVAEVDYPSWKDDTPTEADLSPVGIGSQGAQLTVEHLKIFRDIYYIAEDGARNHYNPSMRDYIRLDHPDPVKTLSTPSLWPRTFADDNMKQATFDLENEQFFALGDNSAKSKDSRLWPPEFPHFVDRDLLIGKALFIYWPHSWGEIPGTRIPFPMFPNFPRMGFVR